MVAASIAALQHAPRPLPLYLDMVRKFALQDPAVAAQALAGVRRYAAAPREAADPDGRTMALGPAQVRVAGQGGPPVLLIPSLINPPDILDLDADRSLLRWLGAMGHQAMLLEWPAPQRGDTRTLAELVEELLIPAIQAVAEPVHLVGYCLGGVLATGAARAARARSLTLIATPWHFDRYATAHQAAIRQIWQQNRAMVEHLGLLPMEVLQTVFWSLDERRAVQKFADFADYPEESAQFRRFVRMEDWANQGHPLGLAAGTDLFDNLFEANLTGRGRWKVAGDFVAPARAGCRIMQIVTRQDRITPAQTAMDGVPLVHASAGHVGMMAGSSAREQCWAPLLQHIAGD